MQKQVNAEIKRTRNELMMMAKERSIKNFRVLNKEELMHVLAEGNTQMKHIVIVAGAVTRWKAGWKTRRCANASKS